MGMIKMYMKKYIKKFPIFLALLAFCPPSNPTTYRLHRYLEEGAGA